VKLKINPFNGGNPMTWKDAAIVATIAAAAIWILSFFANASYAQLASDPGRWIFDAVKNYAVSWAGIFISLAGLEQLVKRTQSGGESRA